MAGLHGWVDGNAVHRVRIGDGDGAARAHSPGLPTLPLPRVSVCCSEVQRAKETLILPSFKQRGANSNKGHAVARR